MQATTNRQETFNQDLSCYFDKLAKDLEIRTEKSFKFSREETGKLQSKLCNIIISNTPGNKFPLYTDNLKKIITQLGPQLQTVVYNNCPRYKGILERISVTQGSRTTTPTIPSAAASPSLMGNTSAARMAETVRMSRAAAAATTGASLSASASAPRIVRTATAMQIAVH